MKKYIKYLYIIILIIILMVGFFIYKDLTLKNSVSHYKCPDEYGDDDASFAQKMADFDSWTKEFFEAHPGASLSDLSKARYDFYIEKNCTDAIKRYEDAVADKGDPETMEMIDNTINKAIGR